MNWTELNWTERSGTKSATLCQSVRSRKTERRTLHCTPSICFRCSFFIFVLIFLRLLLPRRWRYVHHTLCLTICQAHGSTSHCICRRHRRRRADHTSRAYYGTVDPTRDYTSRKCRINTLLYNMYYIISRKSSSRGIFQKNSPPPPKKKTVNDLPLPFSSCESHCAFSFRCFLIETWRQWMPYLSAARYPSQTSTIPYHLPFNSCECHCLFSFRCLSIETWNKLNRMEWQRVPQRYFNTFIFPCLSSCPMHVQFSSVQFSSVQSVQFSLVWVFYYVQSSVQSCDARVCLAWTFWVLSSFFFDHCIQSSGEDLMGLIFFLRSLYSKNSVQFSSVQFSISFGFIGYCLLSSIITFSLAKL